MADLGDQDAARRERDARLALLLQRSAGGEARCFEDFYDATVAYAHALARRMVRPADVDDLLAEAYFQAWREAPRFDVTRGSPVSWLLTLLRSRALDLLRRQRAAPDGEPLPDGADAAGALRDEHPGPEDLLAGCQAGSRLHAALAALAPNERWVLGLAYYRELSHSEISTTTGLPLGTVKSLIQRAQQRLRGTLAAGGPR